jgi:hypothetical protein
LNKACSGRVLCAVTCVSLKLYRVKMSHPYVQCANVFCAISSGRIRIVEGRCDSCRLRRYHLNVAPTKSLNRCDGSQGRAKTRHQAGWTVTAAPYHLHQNSGGSASAGVAGKLLGAYQQTIGVGHGKRPQQTTLLAPNAEKKCGCMSVAVNPCGLRSVVSLSCHATRISRPSPTGRLNPAAT